MDAKRTKHPNVHPFPSSIDRDHFASARAMKEEPPDQASIPHPRLGFFGVVDERMDLKLIEAVAKARPDWNLVIIGPVVKIEPSTLPRQSNIHYLGIKKYAELPSYLAGWDVALVPFSRNESTRFISPTKTPEYLAAGKPVVSTSIADIVRPYGERGFVRIAENSREFIAAISSAMEDTSENWERLMKTDEFLNGMSWDNTWEEMNRLLDAALIAYPDLAARFLKEPSIRNGKGAQLERRRLVAIHDGIVKRSVFYDRRSAVVMR